jgi:NADPH-dependent curcumin reductase CurA
MAVAEQIKGDKKMTLNRRFLLQARPIGMPKPEDFALVQTTLPTPAPGEFIIRNHFASLDPAQRGWMDDIPSYLPPIALGAPVRATTVGRVHASATPDFAVGDWVVGLNALEDYSVARTGGFTSKIDATAVPSVTNYLSVLGAVGLTAYFGLIDAARPKSGETVLVSGAAGAVGSLVGQIAKIHGCRAVGIAGGPQKTQRLIDRYHYDAAIDYRDKDLRAMSKAIKSACPDGVDIYFDNVGGLILDAAMANFNEHARGIMCGMISQYNATTPVPGPTNMWRLITQQASLIGFLVRDYVPRFAQGGAQMAQWLAQGKLVFDEDIQVGLENALPSFLRLFSGANEGKLILKIAE